MLGVAALMIVLYAGLSINPREVPSPLIGKPAPAFDLPTLGSAPARMSNVDLQGRVTLLNVWASWCVSCRVEHPLLVDLARSTKVFIVGLNYKDEPAAARKWLGALGDPYAHSIVDQDGRLGIDWGVYGVPETFVVDQAGVIRLKHIGPLTPADLTDKILPLIRQLESVGS